MASKQDNWFKLLGQRRDLTYLGSSNCGDDNKRSFRCPAGKHVIDVSLNTINYEGKESYRCRCCLEELLEQGAEDRGLTVIKFNVKAHYTRVLCPEGIHEVDIVTAELKQNKDGRPLKTYRCKECAEEEITTLASERGLTEVKKIPGNSKYREFLCPTQKHRIAVKIESLKKGIKEKFPCPDCIDEKNQEIALQRGVNLTETYIVNGVRVGVYVCYCGHCSHVSVQNVNCYPNIPFECRYCAHGRRVNVCVKRGLVPLFDDKYTSVDQKWPVRFEGCGHEDSIYWSVIDKQALYGKPLSCSTCVSIRQEKEAQRVGLLLLGPSSKGPSYKKYMMPCCGKSRSLQTSSVSRLVNRYVCNDCIEDEIRSEAEEQGLILIGMPKSLSRRQSGGYREFRLPCCGGTSEIRREHMKSGNYRCPHCGHSTLLQPSMLYVMRISGLSGIDFLKVGYAKNIGIRMGKIRPADGLTINILKKHQFETRVKSSKAEYWLHKHEVLTEYWIPPYKAKAYMESGYTECYSAAAAPHLKKLFNKAVRLFTS